MSSGVNLLQKPYVSFSSPLLVILRRKITAAAVTLFHIDSQDCQIKAGVYPETKGGGGGCLPGY